ncbi:MAG: tetratricopeptide repeat protein [Terracidiphilus sp.]
MNCGVRKFRKTLVSIPLLFTLLGTNSSHPQALTKPSLDQLLSKAQKGDSDSQYQLGLLYEHGSPETPKDSAEAVKWFIRLADNGDRRGENALGIAYLHGYGVTENEAVGFEWFYKAALKGYPAAQFNLAGAYYQGRGIQKNTKEAFNWFAEAARNGESSAQAVLCIEYQSNRLIEADPTLSYAWCLIAKETGDKHPEVLSTYLNKARSMLSASQLNEAKMLASSWIANHKSGGTMPIHSRSFVSPVSAGTELSVQPSPKGHYTRASGCETGHWVDSVSSDGEIVKLEDGSIWQVDSTDTVDSSLWLTTDDVTVCDGKLINTDDNSSVGAHRLQR